MLLSCKNFATLMTTLILANVALAADDLCPLGFNYIDHICWKIKPFEGIDDNYDGCYGNILVYGSINQEHLDAILQAAGDNAYFWTDYRSLYPGGPYVYWPVHRDIRYRPVSEAGFSDPNFADILCMVVDLRSGRLMRVSCTQAKAQRMCAIYPYPLPARSISSRSDPPICDVEYTELLSPDPVCVSRSRVDGPATWSQFVADCAVEAHLMERSYVHAGHLLGAAAAELPLGIERAPGDGLTWTSGELIPESEWKFESDVVFGAADFHVSLEGEYWALKEDAYTWNEAYCEKPATPHPGRLDLFIRDGLLIVKLIDLDITPGDWRCYTDAAKFYPYRVYAIESDLRPEYTLDAQWQGVYWCSVEEPLFYPYDIQSPRVMFFEDERVYRRFVVLAMVARQLPTEMDVIINVETIDRELSEYIQERFNLTTAGPQPDMGDVLVQPSKPTRIYESGETLLIARVSSEWVNYLEQEVNVSAPLELPSVKLVYARSASQCDTRQLPPENRPPNALPKINLNNTIHLGTCNQFICTEDNYSGAYWLKVINDSYICKSPSEKVKDLEDLFNQIVQNGSSINSTQLETVAHLLNDVLNVSSGVEIPKKILQDLDIIVGRVVLPENETQLKVTQPNVVIAVADSSSEMPVAGLAINRIVDAFENDSVNFILDDDLGQIATNANGTDAIIHVALALNDTSSAHLPARLSFITFKDDAAFSVRRPSSGVRVVRVNSRVIAFRIENRTGLAKGSYVDVHVRPLSEHDPSESEACAFWDFELGENGDWSGRGCRLLAKPPFAGLNACRCDHLTHFAQVIRPRPSKRFGGAHDLALSIVTYVGCALSLLGALGVCATGVAFRSWRRDFSNRVRLNACAAVAALIATFALAAATSGDGDGWSCALLGAALHYTLLAAFAWMFISALVAHAQLVTVFATSADASSGRRLLRLCACGWLAPLAPVAVLFCVQERPYRVAKLTERDEVGARFCYPSGVAFWLSVFAPVALVVAANAILFVVIVRSVFFSRAATRLARRHGSGGEAKELARGLSVGFLLFFLFGLAWSFGLFADELALLYLFCATTTLQGFVMFVFFVLGNARTRALWCALFGAKDELRASSGTRGANKY